MRGRNNLYILTKKKSSDKIHRWWLLCVIHEQLLESDIFLAYRLQL